MLDPTGRHPVGVVPAGEYGCPGPVGIERGLMLCGKALLAIDRACTFAVGRSINIGHGHRPLSGMSFKALPSARVRYPEDRRDYALSFRLDEFRQHAILFAEPTA
jgi:hypothetical protein